MADLRWWIGLVGLVATTLVFVVSMFAFFRRTPGSARKRGGLTAGIALGIVVIYVAVLRRREVDTGTFVVALVLFAVAQMLFWSARRAHGAHRPSAAFADAAPDLLVTGGPYRWIRHPFYTAYVLGFAGGAVLSGSWWSIATCVVMAVVYAEAAREEERLILASALGAAYAHYCVRTGALFPRLRAER